MDNKLAIESLSMDLLRFSIGLNRGSSKTAKRFSEEALLRCKKIKNTNVKPYFARILDQIESCLAAKACARTAEDALMYSVLCQNYAQKYLS
ncbi:MAG: hypothetical protein M1289_01065 [Patescibacteria group bacterium]|nr:hypothetical protein [Patescibacteria group bacterium]